MTKEGHMIAPQRTGNLNIAYGAVVVLQFLCHIQAGESNRGVYLDVCAHAGHAVLYTFPNYSGSSGIEVRYLVRKPGFGKIGDLHGLRKVAAVRMINVSYSVQH